MDPLSTYLLALLKSEGECNSRAFKRYSDSLIEMGYWLLFRPVDCAGMALPMTSIERECRLIDEFPSHYTETEECDSFDVTVYVYQDTSTCAAVWRS